MNMVKKASDTEKRNSETKERETAPSEGFVFSLLRAADDGIVYETTDAKAFTGYLEEHGML